MIGKNDSLALFIIDKSHGNSNHSILHRMRKFHDNFVFVIILIYYTSGASMENYCNSLLTSFIYTCSYNSFPLHLQYISIKTCSPETNVPINT